jgi:predicted XRE-type DNA-binding protein
LQKINEVKKMEDYTLSSGNVFQDIGFADAEEKLTKAKLAAVIYKIIEERGLTQKETAKILGLNQPKVSDLKNGRLKGFSIERLFLFLEALDQHIEITITHKSKVKTEPRINVAYV